MAGGHGSPIGRRSACTVVASRDTNQGAAATYSLLLGTPTRETVLVLAAAEGTTPVHTLPREANGG